MTDSFEVPEESALAHSVFDSLCVSWKTEAETGGYYTDLEDTRYLHRVSSLASAPFDKFDAVRISGLCAGKGKYVGQTPEEVRAVWEQTGLSARTMGTKMHAIIEDFMDGEQTPTQCADRALQSGLAQEWTQFGCWLADTKKKRGLRTFKQEWRVGDPRSRVAGTVDYISEADPVFPPAPAPGSAGDRGKIVIYDWKRSKLVSKAKNTPSSMVGMEHLRDNNFTKYSLQLNIYAELIERSYNLEVVGLYIVQFHSTRRSYKEFEAADLRREARILIDTGGKGASDTAEEEYLGDCGFELDD